MELQSQFNTSDSLLVSNVLERARMRALTLIFAGLAEDKAKSMKAFVHNVKVRELFRKNALLVRVSATMRWPGRRGLKFPKV